MPTNDYPPKYAPHQLAERPAERACRLVAWKPRRSGSLRGFATILFPSGLEISDITVHVAGSRAWANPPGKPWIGADGQLVREPGGKPKYSTIIDFATPDLRRKWSDGVLVAVRAARPEALADAADELYSNRGVEDDAS